MSAASCLLTEDQFLCSICLDVFTDPVTIPCGHNFCQICITDHWKINVTCRCPNCNKLFNSLPELQINHLVSEMAALFRRSAEEKASSSRSEPHISNPGDVLCDACTGTKMKALKSCLRCLASYCETHLEPHLTASRLKRHQLIDPVENLEGRMCKNHDKILGLFCRTDQMCVCMFCSVLDHKTHDFVPLKEEYGEKKAALEKTDAEIQQMIQKRQQKIQEFKRSVELSKEDGDRDIADGVQVFTALKESVKRHEAEFINKIKETHRQTEKQADVNIHKLEQEISELKKRSSEVEQLSHSEDHLHFIQSFLSVSTALPTKDWSEVRIRQPSYEGSVVRAVAQLEETFSKQTKKLFEAELKRVQQYAVDVNLDPDVVWPRPTPSDDRKKKIQGDTCRCVFSQAISSRKFYFEALVKSWPTWTFGVARLLRFFMIRKKIKMSPTNDFWAVCRNSQHGYFATADPPVHLSLKSQPEKVGVIVDYDEGLVSFYDVNTAGLIYSFTGCCFTKIIHPFFSPCPNNRSEICHPCLRNS